MTLEFLILLVTRIIVLTWKALYWLSQPFIKFILNFLPDWRTGSILSRIIRLIFEKPQTKKLLGLGLAILMIFCSLSAPFFSYTVRAESDQEIISPPEKVLTTEHTFQSPVAGTISQEYHWYHPGIDIAENEGWEVKPIANGKVIEKDYQFFGYGHYVVLDHGNGFTSRYAHLKTTAMVEIGQECNKDTVLGLVGSTGRSTGPHLHLEVAENGQTINPLSVIQ